MPANDELVLLLDTTEVFAEYQDLTCVFRYDEFTSLYLSLISHYFVMQLTAILLSRLKVPGSLSIKSISD